ncbi:MAG: oxygen-dependent coproporphyrinogen oxidase, partial [Gammaproteobacteria bacterium]
MDMPAVRQYLSALQTRLGGALAAADGGAFAEDAWESALGRGRGLRLEDGAVFERAGINFSDISGASLPPAATARRPEIAGQKYCAAGVSLVAHPRNPYCPAAHLNVRAFAAGDSWWFGGGMDLTPHYGFAEDCRHFHAACKTALDACDASLYPKFKKQCDEYFYLKHRDEMRGIGGVFFDDFRGRDFADAFAVARAVGDAFAGAYIPLVQKRKDTPYGERETMWQQLRRGRYVEFNLVYDRGTLFG